ncbi:MAG: heavy-metal-associated domain-containing protein [Paracoccaceae bacterium]
MTTFSIPDMSCGHCKASIEAALTPLAAQVEVDLPARQVRVEGGDTARMVAALNAIGFPATVLG